MGIAYKPIPFDDLTAINAVSPLNIETTFEGISTTLSKTLPTGIIVLDGIPTANFQTLIDQLKKKSPNIKATPITEFYIPQSEIQQLIKPYLPMDRAVDPELIFGKLFERGYEPFLDRQAITKFLDALDETIPTIVYGLGSASETFRSKAKTILFIDVTPKDTGLRVFRDGYRCLGYSEEFDLDRVVRQTYFIDNEIAIRTRKDLIENELIDHYLLDSELSFSMLNRPEFHKVCSELQGRPLRAKPIYVEGVWGGQFIRRYRRVPEHLVDKVAWSFELIHTEASLLVQSGEKLIDIPFLSAMDRISESILGPVLNKQFDGYLPIRFNYDDTWHSNGNMSIQVHPTDPMAQQMYGDFAAQNEAYYVVLTGHGAKTFCGFKDDGRKFLELARQSEKDASMVAYDEYIHAIPSDVGRQIFLPAGTVHGSGRNQVVLELGTLTMSAYTYKIYDYTRMDITGKPRPLHTKLAEQALDFTRDASWVMENIAFPPKLLEKGPGWKEFLVGKYDSMYFEAHRIEMETGSRYEGDNGEGFCVITIVDGESARIQSMDAPDRFYEASYLDVILVPASMPRYEVIAKGKQPVVLHKTFVREDKYQ